MNMGINVAAIAVWLLSISALAAAQSSKGCATPGGEVFVVQLEGQYYIHVIGSLQLGQSQASCVTLTSSEC